MRFVVYVTKPEGTFTKDAKNREDAENMVRNYERLGWVASYQTYGME